MAVEVTVTNTDTHLPARISKAESEISKRGEEIVSDEAFRSIEGALDILRQRYGRTKGPLAFERASREAEEGF